MSFVEQWANGALVYLAQSLLAAVSYMELYRFVPYHKLNIGRQSYHESNQNASQISTCWSSRPQEVHASQGLKVGLYMYVPTILGGNSYLSWFYDGGGGGGGGGGIKDPAHTGTSKGLSQAINRGPIRKFLPKYANVYVTIRSHGLSAGARTHYVTANGVRDGLTVITYPIPSCTE